MTESGRGRGRGRGGRGGGFGGRGRGRGRGGRGGGRGRGGRGNGNGGGQGRGRGKGGEEKCSDPSSSVKMDVDAKVFVPGEVVNAQPASTVQVRVDVTNVANGRFQNDKTRDGRGKGGKKQNKSKKGKGSEMKNKGDSKSSDVPSKIEGMEDDSAKMAGNNNGSKNNSKKKKKKEQNDNKNKEKQSKSKKGGDNDAKKNENESKNPKPNKERRDEKKTKKSTGDKSKGRNNKSFQTKVPEASIPPSKPQTTNDLNYKRGSKVTVLHIAEKPSIATSIAKGLCRGNYSEGGGRSLPVHEFSDPSFPKAPHATTCVHRVTSVAGHVFNVDFPTSYQSWDSVDPADLFHAPIVKKPCKGSIVRHLSDCAKGVDFIVLWLDCDREGENIAFEVLECCMNNMEGRNEYDRVYRAYFSAINPSDIQKAYHALGKPDRNQSLAVDARQELDLKVGVAFSRFQTRYFQGRYGDLDSAVLSYGPCQTPTLHFCVKRHVDIETFKPQPYWLLNLGLYKRGRVVKAQSQAGRSFKQQKIQQLINDVFEGTSPAVARVTSVVSKDKKQGRPVPLNTVSLLKACSKALGIGPHAAMSTAERLYLSGYLSYPRTESSSYPKSFDIKGALQMQAGDGRWGSYASGLLVNGDCKAKGGVDMGDHPPITPMRAAGVHELSGDMARVYELVTRHFIASVSQDALWKNTTVSLNIDALKDKGKFTIRGKSLMSPGFLAILLHKEYGDEKDELDEYTLEDDNEEIENLPEFNEGETFALSSIGKSSSKVETVAVGQRATLGVKEKMTTPPKYLTESELIGQMERNGIGTDASIATHIENIMKRNYVELHTGRRLVPTKLGLTLVQGYHLIDSSLVLPRVRADIESQCNKIAKGEADKDAVIKVAIEIFSNKFENFVKDINKMDILFSSSFAKLEDVGKPFTRCGSTGRYLQYITGPPPRLYNKFTETVYPLPVGGVIREWSGRKCPVEGCGFELCMYSCGQPERTFPLCPNCFNNPRPEWGNIPGEDIVAAEDEVDRDDENKERQIRTMGGRSFTLECPHPDGHPLIEELTVAKDPEGDGVLTLDTHFGPKWRLVSTRDPTVHYLPNKAIDKVTILEKRDENTGHRMMKIEFKEGKSPLKDGSKSLTTAYFKNEAFQETVRIYHGNERTQRKGSGRGGRGRGRGRGGRGRGGRGGRGRR